jgi:hypothetical protein
LGVGIIAATNAAAAKNLSIFTEKTSGWDTHLALSLREGK